MRSFFCYVFLVTCFVCVFCSFAFLVDNVLLSFLVLKQMAKWVETPAFSVNNQPLSLFKRMPVTDGSLVHPQDSTLGFHPKLFRSLSGDMFFVFSICFIFQSFFDQISVLCISKTFLHSFSFHKLLNFPLKTWPSS